MKWNRFTVKTKTEAEDIVISTLAEVGIEGVEIQDKQPLTEEDKAQMFVDIMPEGPADDGIAYLNFYLDEDFRPEYLKLAADIRSEEYYVNMMIAWYLATALAKQWEATIPYIEERRLPEWVHRKTIQKAVESYRITPEQKVYLKSFR